LFTEEELKSRKAEIFVQVHMEKIETRAKEMQTSWTSHLAMLSPDDSSVRTG
jgi:hypothetical protein